MLIIVPSAVHSLHQHATLDPSIVHELKQWPPFRQLDDVPSRYEVEEAIRALANRRMVGPDGLLAELLKVLADEREFNTLGKFHDIIVAVWRGGGVPQEWKEATMKVLHKEKYRSECGHYRAIPLVADAGKVLLKVIAGRLSDFCEGDNILPEEQCGFRPQRSTVDMMGHDVRSTTTTGTGAEEGHPLVIALYRSHQTYDSADRTLLWDVLARCGVPPRMLAVIRQFHDGMQACARFDDRECSDKFDVGQGLRQGSFSSHWCSTCYSQRHCVWPRNESSLMQPSRTTWCSSNERRKARKSALHEQATSTGGGGRRGIGSRDRGVC